MKSVICVSYCKPGLGDPLTPLVGGVRSPPSSSFLALGGSPPPLARTPLEAMVARPRSASKVIGEGCSTFFSPLSMEHGAWRGATATEHRIAYVATGTAARYEDSYSYELTSYAYLPSLLTSSPIELAVTTSCDFYI